MAAAHDLDLPAGWSTATDPYGRTYYASDDGEQTSWHKPVVVQVGEEGSVTIKSEEERQAFFSSVAKELIRTQSSIAQQPVDGSGSGGKGRAVTHSSSPGWRVPRVSVAQLYKRARQEQVREQDYATWVGEQLETAATARSEGSSGPSHKAASHNGAAAAADSGGAKPGATPGSGSGGGGGGRSKSPTRIPRPREEPTGSSPPRGSPPTVGAAAGAATSSLRPPSAAASGPFGGPFGGPPGADAAADLVISEAMAVLKEVEESTASTASAGGPGAPGANRSSQYNPLAAPPAATLGGGDGTRTPAGASVALSAALARLRQSEEELESVQSAQAALDASMSAAGSPSVGTAAPAGAGGAADNDNGGELPAGAAARAESSLSALDTSASAAVDAASQILERHALERVQQQEQEEEQKQAQSKQLVGQQQPHVEVESKVPRRHMPGASALAAGATHRLPPPQPSTPAQPHHVPAPYGTPEIQAADVMGALTATAAPGAGGVHGAADATGAADLARTHLPPVSPSSSSPKAASAWARERAALQEAARRALERARTAEEEARSVRESRLGVSAQIKDLFERKQQEASTLRAEVAKWKQRATEAEATVAALQAKLMATAGSGARAGGAPSAAGGSGGAGAGTSDDGGGTAGGGLGPAATSANGDASADNTGDGTAFARRLAVAHDASERLKEQLKVKDDRIDAMADRVATLEARLAAASAAASAAATKAAAASSSAAVAGAGALSSSSPASSHLGGGGGGGGGDEEGEVRELLGKMQALQTRVAVSDAGWQRKLQRLEEQHALALELKEAEWRAERDEACDQLQASGQARQQLARQQLAAVQEERKKWLAERATLTTKIEAAEAERAAAMQHVEQVKKLRATAVAEAAEAKRQAEDANEVAVLAERSRQQARRVAEELMSGDDAAAKLAIVQATKMEMREHWLRMRKDADRRHEVEKEALREALVTDRDGAVEEERQRAERALQQARNEWEVAMHKRQVEADHALSVKDDRLKEQVTTMALEADLRLNQAMAEAATTHDAARKAEARALADAHAEELASKVAAEVVLRETSLLRLRHGEALRRLGCYYTRCRSLALAQTVNRWRAAAADAKMHDVAELTLQHTAQCGATERIVGLLFRGGVRSLSRAVARWKTFLVMDAAARYRQSAVGFVNRMVAAGRVFAAMRKMVWMRCNFVMREWRAAVGLSLAGDGGGGQRGGGGGEFQLPDGSILDRDAASALTQAVADKGELQAELDSVRGELSEWRTKAWKLKRQLIRKFEEERG